MSALATALISALTSVAVVLVSFFLSSRDDRKKAAQAEWQELNARYLNPLRLHLVETRFRLAEILLRTGESGQCEDLLTIDAPADLSDREPGWFANWGAYLVSSAYLTACLFAWLKKTRDSAPYLRIGSEDDTRLSVLMLHVSHSFLRDQGIYYVLQPSIGQDMILATEDRLISYREFCELLLTPGAPRMAGQTDRVLPRDRPRDETGPGRGRHRRDGGAVRIPGRCSRRRRVRQVKAGS